MSAARHAGHAPRVVGARVAVLTGDHAPELAARLSTGSDVRINLEALAAALGDTAAPHVRHVALGALAGALERATRLREPVMVWIIHPDPSPEVLEDYHRRGFALLGPRAVVGDAGPRVGAGAPTEALSKPHGPAMMHGAHDTGRH
ncbi:hypothetical protein GCM10025865_09230 [Paraoerskovia sediminicola]|uniref:Uncharacterized protein n=1 Tax=Paraoerskovia sediminicola TaxID=1138587 RepID=A0ABN6X9X0_9CELL|nr:hypothetical protein [Paraoerskovia sediminicola]BDZ41624.1 hypothetical protein GCM10025865_09230 [Paraoerskovia sediminicola]